MPEEKVNCSCCEGDTCTKTPVEDPDNEKECPPETDQDEV